MGLSNLIVLGTPMEEQTAVGECVDSVLSSLVDMSLAPHSYWVHFPHTNFRLSGRYSMLRFGVGVCLHVSHHHGDIVTIYSSTLSETTILLKIFVTLSFVMYLIYKVDVQ